MIKNSLLIIYLIIPLFLYSQSAMEGLDRMNEISKNYKTNKGEWRTVMPWQSVRLLETRGRSVGSYSIDIRGTYNEVMAYDPGNALRDLFIMGLGGTLNMLEVTQRGYEMRLQWPGHNTPITNLYWFWHPTDPDWSPNNVYDPDNCPSPCNGWYHMELENKLCWAIKDLGNGQFQASYVQFIIRN